MRDTRNGAHGRRLNTEGNPMGAVIVILFLIFLYFNPCLGIFILLVYLLGKEGARGRPSARCAPASTRLPMRLPVVVEEWTRERPTIDIARQLGPDDERRWLSWLMAKRGVPDHVRSDSGSEFAATAVRK